tara:strand:- start:449 stop:655 length:207 start_codon:yes stop_codon:yes gene_type:complete
MDDKRLKNIINMVRSLNLKEEIANSAGGGGIAGLPPDQPPVNLKKKKRPPIIARGLMPGARKRWSGKQ